MISTFFCDTFLYQQWSSSLFEVYTMDRMQTQQIFELDTSILFLDRGEIVGLYVED